MRDETRTLTGAQYTYTTGFQYDTDGNRAVVKYLSTQLTVAYGFDYAGRPTSASNLVTTASYLPFGPLKTLSFANGTTQTLGYDARYRVTANSLLFGQNPLAQYTYGYDATGNITSILDATDPGYDRTFQYDGLNRLITANTGSALWWHGSYTWDAMGNMRSLKLGEIEKGPTDPLDAARPHRDRLQVEENVPLGRSSNFGYDGTTPRLLEVTTNDLSRAVGSDPAGNETSYVATRTYSLRNLLAEVTDSGEPGDPLQHKLTYTYDGRGIRVIRAETPADGPNTTARRYSIYTPELQLLAVTRDDASNIWALSAADKNIHYEIVWFAGRPIAQVTPAGARLFTFADHLGTPILQTDATATITWRAEYEPFGNVYEMRAGNRADQPLRLPGQEVAMNWEGQEENYNIHRWYRSRWGRYTQADPLPKPWHPYDYTARARLFLRRWWGRLLEFLALGGDVRQTFFYGVFFDVTAIRLVHLGADPLLFLRQLVQPLLHFRGLGFLLIRFPDLRFCRRGGGISGARLRNRWSMSRAGCLGETAAAGGRADGDDTAFGRVLAGGDGDLRGPHERRIAGAQHDRLRQCRFCRLGCGGGRRLRCRRLRCRRLRVRRNGNDGDPGRDDQLAHLAGSVRFCS